METNTHTLWKNKIQVQEKLGKYCLKNIMPLLAQFFSKSNLSPKIRSQNHYKWKKLRLLVCLLAFICLWLLACLCLCVPWKHKFKNLFNHKNLFDHVEGKKIVQTCTWTFKKTKQVFFCKKTPTLPPCNPKF